MDSMRIAMLVAVVAVVVVSRFNRKIGGIMGVILTAAIAWWGFGIYSGGGHLAMAGAPLSKTWFIVFLAVFFMYNIFSIWIGYRAGREKNGGDAGGGGGR
jgi:hypothetical protein